MSNESMHWASVWGNAVSIAENRPESFSKTLLFVTQFIPILKEPASA